MLSYHVKSALESNLQIFFSKERVTGTYESTLLQFAFLKIFFLRIEFHFINFEKDGCAENLTHEYCENKNLEKKIMAAKLLIRRN